MFRQLFRNRNRLAVCMISACLLTVVIMGSAYYFRTQPRANASNTAMTCGTGEETSSYSDNAVTMNGQLSQYSASVSENTSEDTCVPTEAPDTSQTSSLATTQSTTLVTTAATTTVAATQSTTVAATQSTTVAATTTETTSSGGSYSYNRGLEAEVLVLLNQYRADAGLSALTCEPTIQAWSDLRASEITAQGAADGNSVYAISHTRPDGGSPWDGYPGVYSVFGENLAGGQATATDVVTAWMNSPGHKENIMNADFTSVGISCICYEGVYYWASDFVG